MPQNPLIVVSENFTTDHKKKSVAELFNEFSPRFGVLDKNTFVETVGFIKDMKGLDDKFLQS